MTNRRVLILARQSLTRADSVSLAVQRDTLTTYYAERGDQIVGILSSENTKGWQEDRADLSEAVARAKAGEYEVLAVYTVDRLARNVRILETVVHELGKHGVSIDSPNDSWVSDPLVRQLMGAIAESFSRTLSRRMTGVVTHKVSQGRHQGPAPFGFERGEDDHLVPSAYATAAAAMFALRVQGLSREDIAARLLTDYSASIDGASVLRSLRNPAYAGGIKGPGGVVIWDAHEGIVSRETWDHVQRLLDSRRRATRSDTPHWLEGLAYCGCGSPLYRNETKPGLFILRCGRHLDRGDCPNPVHGIRLERAELIVLDQFGRDLSALAAANHDEIVARLTARQDAAYPAWEKERDKLRARRTRLATRRDVYVEMRADGNLTRDEFRAKMVTLDAQVAAVETALTNAPHPVDQPAIARTIDLAGYLAAAVDDLAVRNPSALRTALTSWDGRLVLTDPPKLDYAVGIAELLAVVRAHP